MLCLPQPGPRCPTLSPRVTGGQELCLEMTASCTPSRGSRSSWLRRMCSPSCPFTRCNKRKRDLLLPLPARPSWPAQAALGGWPVGDLGGRAGVARAGGVSSLLRQRCLLGYSLWSPWPLPGSRVASILTGSSGGWQASLHTLGTKNRSAEGLGDGPWHGFSISSHLLLI